MVVKVENLTHLVSTLKNRTIRDAKLENSMLTLTLDDGSTLTAGARSGPGADGGWYDWTEIRLNGKKILDE